MVRFCSQRFSLVPWEEDPEGVPKDFLTGALEDEDRRFSWFPKFLDLPAELRSIVYKFAAVHTEHGQPPKVWPAAKDRVPGSLLTLAITQILRKSEANCSRCFTRKTHSHSKFVTIASRCRKWSDLIGENAVDYIAVESASAGDWALYDDMSYDVMLVVDLRGITVKVRLDSEEKCEDCAKDNVGVGRTIEEIESKVERERTEWCTSQRRLLRTSAAPLFKHEASVLSRARSLSRTAAEKGL